MVAYPFGGYFGDTSFDDAVQSVPKQDTSIAARQALQEQAPGSEFHPLPNPEIEMLVNRLNELNIQQTALSTKLYDPPNWYRTHDTSYEGPPYLQRAILQEQMSDLDTEICRIKAWLSTHIDASMLEAPGDDEKDGV